MDFVGHAWRMASAWRLRLHDGRSFERDRHGLMVLLAHVFVRSLEASLDAMGVVFDGAVSLASPLLASHAMLSCMVIRWPPVAVMVMCWSRT